MQSFHNRGKPASFLLHTTYGAFLLCFQAAGAKEVEPERGQHQRETDKRGSNERVEKGREIERKIDRERGGELTESGKRELERESERENQVEEQVASLSTGAKSPLCFVPFPYVPAKRESERQREKERKREREIGPELVLEPTPAKGEITGKVSLQRA